MDAKTLKTAFGKAFSCFTCRASYKVDSKYGSLTKIKIPYNIATALNDEHFGYCWRQAVEAELEGKFAADFNFEYVITIPDCRKVMKGMWIFKSENDPYAAVINFMALHWVTDGSSMVESVAYENTYKDIGLTLINKEPEVMAFQGPSWHSGDGVLARG